LARRRSGSSNHKAALAPPATSLAWRNTEQEFRLCTADSVADGGNTADGHPLALQIGCAATRGGELTGSEQLGDSVSADARTAVCATLLSLMLRVGPVPFSLQSELLHYRFLLLNS